MAGEEPTLMLGELSPERLRALPGLPGVYLMKDREGKVLYVGKAKNLRSRVRTYFSGGDGRYSVPYLVRRVAAVETVITEDEVQALALESDFIKKFKPQYNIRLKDDKAYLLARIDLNQDWPRIELVRRVEDDGAVYVGPFTFGYELDAMLETIRSMLPLRSCSDKVFKNRVRPCLEYQIKRCAGPCCLDVDKQQYRSWAEDAISILKRKNDEVLRSLQQRMEQASEEMRFEEAAILRDRIEVLKKAGEEKPQYFFSEGAKDAIGLYREETKAEISVLRVRRGRLFGALTFGFSDLSMPDDELLASFLSQFYTQDQDIPEEILLPFEIEDSAARGELYGRERGGKVTLSVPSRGDRVRLTALADKNARENFIARFGGTDQSEDSTLKGLQRDLGLEEVPRSIECVDISHFQGGSTVASVVFFHDGRPDKNRYRHFNLTQEGKPDDFASMREVTMRHLSRCAEENTLSDLMVIDGGRTQLAQALAVRAELGLKTPVMIGLAKKRGIKLPYYALLSGQTQAPYKPERVYVEDRPDAIILRESSKALLLLAKIRDEAHRFAITFHRQSRARRTFTSSLERIPGVGEKRRKDLLRAFGSVEAIRNASPGELTQRCGIPPKLAELILRVLAKREQRSGE